MSLDVYLTAVRETKVYQNNITHNLGGMAKAANIYYHLWRPEEIGVTKAEQLIEPLEAGLKWLHENKQEAEKYNAPNGWGTYEHFVPWVAKYLEACRDNPDADVRTYR